MLVWTYSLYPYTLLYSILLSLQIMNIPRKPRLYYLHPLNIGQIISLEPQAAQHITRVLRMQVGEEVILFNNLGGEYTGIIKEIKKKTDIEVCEYHERNSESPLQLHLGQSLVRSDRMDFIIQKATELGVHHITPLVTMRSMIKLDKKQLEKKIQHWSNIMISAAQQCGRTHLPTLNLPMPFQQFVSTPFMGANIAFDLSATASLKSITPNPSAIRVLIGPESGFDESEMTFMTTHKFELYTLGPRVLRTETASIAALCSLQLLYGDLSLG